MSEQKYQERLHAVIPGGCHTYSRGDDQFPSNAPKIFSHGEGAYLYTPNAQKYLDYGMGLRSVNIGYGNREIAEAAYLEILKGNNLTRASMTELAAAELLVQAIPSIEMVKFAKHGSTVTTAAVKLARAFTGRKYVAVPVEHPFYSFDDWFIGSTVITRGVPEEYRKLTLKFHYNDIDSVNTLFENYPGQIAAIMTEPATTIGPKGNFLHELKQICEANGALLILDEMITGFRWHLQGAQTYYDITPDLCTFGKAMANGFAVAALGGKRELMEIGGILDAGGERVFLTSTTHGAEMSSLGAFIKTYEILKEQAVIEYIWHYGSKLMDGMNSLAQKHGISEFFYVEGYPCSPNYVTKNIQGQNCLKFRTLFNQELLKNNLLMPYIAISFAHRETELSATLEAVDSALGVYSKALEAGVDQLISGNIIKPVFRKFNYCFH